jgi:ABC-type oligopeptide transport system substrate-binding subunit
MSVNRDQLILRLDSNAAQETDMRSFITSLIVASALVIAGAGTAFAEMVYHRGNAADPETLDQHKTSTVYEAHILRDLYEGAWRKAGPSPTTA